jgi:hypothetical protein
VDGMVKCEKWIRDEEGVSEESKASWWLNRLIGQAKKASIEWPYPFVEDHMFVLTLTAGLEGYHVNVDGRHVASFPYRTVSVSNMFMKGLGNIMLFQLLLRSFVNLTLSLNFVFVVLAGVCARGCHWLIIKWGP